MNTTNLLSLIPEPSGDYARDCENGRKFANTVLQTLKDTQNPSALFFVVSSLAERENTLTGGVGVAFFQVIGERLS